MKCMMNATMAVAAVSVLALGTVSQAAADTAACDLKIKLTMKAEMMEGGANFKGTLGTAMAGMKMDKMPGMKKEAMAGMKMDKMAGMKKEPMAGMKKEAMAGMKMDKMPAMKKEPMAGMKMDKMAGMKKEPMAGMKKEPMAGMKGAHEIHDGQYGGTFFMAPNKTHHIEGIYSKDCGFRLVLFNAHTQPINVNRFGAFVKYIPEDEDTPEAYRILSSAHEGSVLQVPSNPEIKGEFDVELYVSFPGSDDLSMFNIRVKH